MRERSELLGSGSDGWGLLDFLALGAEVWLLTVVLELALVVLGSPLACWTEFSLAMEERALFERMGEPDALCLLIVSCLLFVALGVRNIYPRYFLPGIL